MTLRKEEKLSRVTRGMTLATNVDADFDGLKSGDDLYFQFVEELVLVLFDSFVGFTDNCD